MSSLLITNKRLFSKIEKDDSSSSEGKDSDDDDDFIMKKLRRNIPIELKQGEESFTIPEIKKLTDERGVQRRDGYEWSSPQEMEQAGYGQKWKDQQEYRHKQLQKSKDYQFASKVSAIAGKPVTKYFDLGDTVGMQRREDIFRIQAAKKLQEQTLTLKALEDAEIKAQADVGGLNGKITDTNDIIKQNEFLNTNFGGPIRSRKFITDKLQIENTAFLVIRIINLRYQQKVASVFKLTKEGNYVLLSKGQIGGQIVNQNGDTVQITDDEMIQNISILVEALAEEERTTNLSIRITEQLQIPYPKVFDTDVVKDRLKAFQNGDYDAGSVLIGMIVETIIDDTFPDEITKIPFTGQNQVAIVEGQIAYMKRVEIELETNTLPDLERTFAETSTQILQYLPNFFAYASERLLLYTAQFGRYGEISFGQDLLKTDQVDLNFLVFRIDQPAVAAGDRKRLETIFQKYRDFDAMKRRFTDKMNDYYSKAAELDTNPSKKILKPKIVFVSDPVELISYLQVLRIHNYFLKEELKSQQKELADAIKTQNSIKARLDTIRTGGSITLQEPNVPYKHDPAWVNNPINSGVVNLTFAFVEAMNQAYAYVQQFISSVKQASVEELQKDTLVCSFFAKLVAVQLTEFAINGQSQYTTEKFYGEKDRHKVNAVQGLQRLQYDPNSKTFSSK